MIDNLTSEEERILRIAYVQTFGTEAGQKVLKDLQARCFKYQTPLIAGDPYGTHANLGAQQVILTIENMMSDEDIQRLAKANEREE